MKTPTEYEKNRVMSIRVASKKGDYVSPEDLRFCTLMFKTYPEWHASLDRKIFVRTDTFGSNIEE